MSRLIEADAVYKILESCEIEKATIGNPLTDWEYGYNCGIERAESEIECAPTVEAEPVRHGRWITDSFPMDDGDYLMERCTACGTAIEYGMGTPYCPFCGAKMDGGANGPD